MAVPWDAINSGLVDEAELADPRKLAEVRTAYDPHLVLGLEPGATAEAVRSAFRSLSREHHPDRGGDAERFQTIQAAHDALVGVGATGSVLPFGCALCPSRGGKSASRKDVVRCILVDAASSRLLTLDEREGLLVSSEGQRVAAEAPPEVSLLCASFLDKKRRLAVGGTKGHLAVTSLDEGSSSPTPVPLGTRAAVLALAAPEWTDQSPLLFASVDGEVLAIDVDGGCVLCSLGAPLAPLRAEALLCPRVPQLDGDEDEETSRWFETAVPPV